MSRPIKIKIYKKPLKIKDYDNWVDDSSQFETEDMPYSVNPTQLQKSIGSVMKDKKYVNSKPSSDAVLARTAHQTFRKLPNNILTDNRFWQWISLNLFLKYSEWRWDITQQNIEEQPNILRHLISGKGVTGLSHNSISRLVVPTIDLYKSPSDYSLVDILFQNQQTEQSITQSMQSMNPQVIKAMVKSVKGLDGDGVKAKIKRLNALSDAYNIDLMTEAEILKLVG